MSIRDTHFQNAAKLLTIQMYRRFGHGIELSEEAEKELQTLLAQYSYDLVEHTIDSLWLYIDDTAVDPSATDIPDMTEWPKTE